MTDDNNRTGYPSIDKPWLKYYSEEAINSPLPEMTMYQYAWENNKGDLGDIAFRYFGSKITYGEFFENVKKTAKAFSAMGIVAEDIVTIMSMHTPETVYAIYALNYIGAVANLVYMTLSENEILHTVENTDSKMFLFLDAAADRVAHIRSEIKVPVVMLSVADSMPKITGMFYRLKSRNFVENTISFREFLEKGKDSGLPPASTAHEKMAVIVYTSGTTGEPKGVMLNSDGLNSIVSQLIQTDRCYQRGDKVLLSIPIFLGYGISMIHLLLSAGMYGDLHIIMAKEAVGQKFYKFKPQRFVTGPPWLDGIMANVRGDMSYCVEITGGGASISQEKETDFNDFLKRHGSKTIYLNGYGMTEFGSAVTVNMFKAHKMGSLGVPFIYVNVCIEDIETRKELQFGKVGELCVQTPSIMLGYYQNADETEKVIYTDEHGTKWMRTGDLGYIDEEGFVYLTGRIKRTYMTKGSDGVIYRIFPQRMEELFQTDPDIKVC